jgi:hypothetical protein
MPFFRCLAFACLLSLPLSAQVAGGSIVGVATDPSGAPVAGVNVPPPKGGGYGNGL